MRKRKRRDNRERNCENRSPIEISIAFRPRNVNFRVELLLVIHPVIKTRGYLLHAKRHGERGMKVAGEGKRRENTGCTQREKLHREQKPVVTGRFNYIYLPKMTRLRRRGFVLAETRFFSPLLVSPHPCVPLSSGRSSITRVHVLFALSQTCVKTKSSTMRVSLDTITRQWNRLRVFERSFIFTSLTWDVWGVDLWMLRASVGDSCCIEFGYFQHSGVGCYGERAGCYAIESQSFGIFNN